MSTLKEDLADVLKQLAHDSEAGIVLFSTEDRQLIRQLLEEQKLKNDRAKNWRELKAHALKSLVGYGIATVVAVATTVGIALYNHLGPEWLKTLVERFLGR